MAESFENYIKDRIIQNIILKYGVNKKVAKKLFLDSLSSNLVIEEIMLQIENVLGE